MRHFIIIELMLLISYSSPFTAKHTWYTSRKLLNQGRKVVSYYSLRRSTIKMMPEGPEVRTLVKKLQPAIGMRLLNINFVSGRYVNNQKPVGFDEFRKTMSHQIMEDDNDFVNHDKIDLVQQWNCKGKFIWIVLDNGVDASSCEHDIDNDYLRSMWITLGMSGRFYNEKDVDKKSTSLRWYLEFWDWKANKIRRIYYIDPRGFGTLKCCTSALELQRKIDSLGPDILNDETTEDVFLDCLSSYKSRQPSNICKLLMNQKVVSGVGNYLLSEGLYKSNIDPFASLDEINDNQRRLLYHTLRTTALQSFLSKINNNDEFELECYGLKISSSGKEVVREGNGPHGRTIWFVEDQLFLPLAERRLRDEGEEDNTILNQSSEDLDNIGTIDLKPFLIENSWRKSLQNFVSSDKFANISKFLDNERHQGHTTIYPPSKDIFSALNLCPLENVKVVIVGQDPYHGPNQAHGLAFSVQKQIPIPPSLRNIFKEISNDIGIQTNPKHGNLEYWAKQGVLLLNTVLTVRRGEANSHAKIGWEDFTDEILNILNTEKEELVFLLWGNAAIKKVKGVVDESKHVVITTSHPSPLGATKTSSPFIGSRCFSRCNDILDEAGLDPIDWSIM